MNYREKLHIIQELTGLSQEKLAQQLGVAFSTLNKWINEKAQPRKSAQKQIDVLFGDISGIKEEAGSALKAKLSIIQNKRKSHKSIIHTIVNYPDIHNQFVLSLTYNTNSIEGSTLTEHETKVVLFENAALGHKTLKEQLEVKNHQAALEFLFSFIMQKKKVDIAFILRLHSILMNGIRDDAGAFRNHAVRIVGANVPTANHLKVRELMNGLLKKINSEKNGIVYHSAYIHSVFEKIHPFSDGNGRVGRLLAYAMLLSQNYPPAVILQKKRNTYMKALNRSQRDDDFDLLHEFFADSVLEGFKILERI